MGQQTSKKDKVSKRDKKTELVKFHKFHVELCERLHKKIGIITSYTTLIDEKNKVVELIINSVTYTTTNIVNKICEELNALYFTEYNSIIDEFVLFIFLRDDNCKQK